MFTIPMTSSHVEPGPSRADKDALARRMGGGEENGLGNQTSNSSKAPTRAKPRFKVGGKSGFADGTNPPPAPAPAPAPVVAAVDADELRKRRIARLGAAVAAAKPRKKKTSGYQPRFKGGGILGTGPPRTDLAGGGAGDNR